MSGEGMIPSDSAWQPSNARSPSVGAYDGFNKVVMASVGASISGARPMTEQTMIERMARAMALADGEDYMEDHRRFDRYARVALTAMREPTEAMVLAADENDGMSDFGDKFDPSIPWVAMIDAALAEES